MHKVNLHRDDNSRGVLNASARTMVITEGGHYGDLHLTGIEPSAMQGDIALKARTHFHETVNLGYVKIRDCGLPLQHTSGKLKIKTLDCKRFTADLGNSCGRLEIENLIVEYNNPDFDYSDSYHVDALFQFFDHSTKIVSDVKIHNIYARIKGKHVQGMMLSEDHLYRNFQIGTGKVDIKIEYPYAFVANTLLNSSINVGNNGIKIKNVKGGDHKSGCVEVMRYSEDQLIVTDFDTDWVKSEFTPEETRERDSILMEEDYQIIPNYMDLSPEDLSNWKARWPNFNPYELASRDFSVRLYTKSLDALQAIRTEWDKPLHINSAWRNPRHNKAVGGKSNSDHTWLDHREINASAYDVHIDSIQMGRELEKLAIKHGFNVIGRYRKSMFIHISMREPKSSGRIYQWGRW